MKVPKSKYKYVWAHWTQGKYLWWKGVVQHNGVRRGKDFKNERDAALWCDKALIEFGLPPVNILKPKPRS